jgi:hypothetical protein
LFARKHFLPRGDRMMRAEREADPAARRDRDGVGRIGRNINLPAAVVASGYESAVVPQRNDRVGPGVWVHLVWATLERRPLLTKAAAAKLSTHLTDYAAEKEIY